MIVEIMKSEVGRPTEDNVVRQNLKHYKRELRFKKKLSEVFEFWRGIVVKKAEGHSKAVSMGRKYLATRERVFGGNPPKTALTYNKYIDNMDELYGEIIDKFLVLPNKRQKRVLKSKYPIRDISKLTNLKFKEVFPSIEDNQDFEAILLSTSFSKDEVIKR